MLMGPVFHAELLRTARRGRYYILRLLYGAVLLLIIWSGYQQTFASARTARIAAVAMFAFDTFFMFAIVQLLTVLVLIPPLFAGTIADEKQRKTLHYLMASQLSSGEIVADKVLGRLPHLAVFLAIGLPVVSIMGIFGGVPARVCGRGLCRNRFHLCLRSGADGPGVDARAARPAGRSHLLFAHLHMAVRPVVRCLDRIEDVRSGLSMDTARKRMATAVEPGCSLDQRHAAALGPSVSLSDGRFFLDGRPSARWRGVFLAHRRLEAAARLPPSGRDPSSSDLVCQSQGPTAARDSSTGPSAAATRCSGRNSTSPPTDVFTRMVLLPAIVLITLPLALLTEVHGDLGREVSDFWQSGLSARLLVREGLAWALRVDLGWYTALWLLAVAGASAASIAIEREEDTWVSLTATPLTGWQIVRGKVLGAVWNQRGFAAVLGFIWLLGLVTGAVQPLGALASVALVGVLTWLVAAVGIHASLQATTTSRALARAIVALCLFNGYPFILVFWFTGSLSWDSSFTLLGFMPRLAVTPLVSPQFAAQRWLGPTGQFGLYTEPVSFVPAGRFVLVAIYVVAAAILTWASLAGSTTCSLDRD